MVSNPLLSFIHNKDNYGISLTE